MTSLNRQSAIETTPCVWIRMVIALQSPAPDMPSTIDQTRHDRCPACAHVYPAGSSFCNACGTRLSPQPSSGPTPREAPRPWFHTPLLPEDVRHSLGPLALHGTSKQLVSNTSEPTPSMSHAPEVGGTASWVPHAREVPPVEAQLAARGHPRIPGHSAGRLRGPSAAQQPEPRVAGRYSVAKGTLARALVTAALIACIGIGTALFLARQASVQRDTSTARQQVEQGSNAATSESRPIDHGAAIEPAPSVTAESVSAEPLRNDSSKAPSAIEDTPGAPIGQDKELRTPSAGVGQSSDDSPEPGTPTAGAPAPRGKEDTSTSELSSATPARTSSRQGMKAPIAEQQGRRAGSRADNAARQQAKNCSVQQRVLGLCKS
jgi:hypothetical protein